MPARAPLILGIGLPYSGAALLAALFEANGHLWRHHMSGKLAQNVAYAQATDTPALASWPKAIGFSGFYHMHRRHLPHLRVQDLFRTLQAQFPDAYFIHTHRAPADWVAARFWADNGNHRTVSAWHAGVSDTDLPAYWINEQAAHAAQCAAYFDGNTRFLDFNTTSEGLEKVKGFLKSDYTLDMPETLPGLAVTADSINAVVTFIDQAAVPTNSRSTDITFTTQVTDFCMQNQGLKGVQKTLSRSAVVWNENDTITGHDGTAADIVRAGHTFLMPPGGDERVQGTLNELVAHGARPPLHIDMLDARFMGADGRRTAPRKTIVYNRRVGAKNLTLWPLPGYHTLAPRGAVGGFAIDTVPFESKLDRCVWLGNMTGRMSPVLAPEGRARHGVYHIRDRALGPDPDWADIIADLDCVPRYRTVKTLRDNPDFEVGFVLRPKWKPLSNTPAFKGLCDPKQDRTWFHRFRYILSLAGNDTGSNFLSAASSSALILKEEDGWELYYTKAFKPWVHYVPLREGATDIEEKLAWARGHPDECAAMIQAATDLYDQFANPDNRAAILHGIAEQLNALD